MEVLEALSSFKPNRSVSINKKYNVMIPPAESITEIDENIINILYGVLEGQDVNDLYNCHEYILLNKIQDQFAGVQ